MNIAIHGEKELLVRLKEDLKGKLQRNEIFVISPDSHIKYGYVFDDKPFDIPLDEHHLTPSNYNEVLETILNSVKNKQND